MNSTRIFKKGDYLFKAGDKATVIYAIQSGSVSVFVPRPKTNIEMYVAGNSNFVGEQSLFGVTHHLFSAQATSETKVFEIPVDILRGQMDAGSSMTKALTKSLGERARSLLAEVKSFKIERDNRPCPEEEVPKAFGVFYHCARYLGAKNEKNPALWTVDWRQMRSYGQKVFMENPKRAEQILMLFKKIKLLEIQMVKSEDDPKAPEELGYVHFNDLPMIEQFFEYFQYCFYKPGKSDLLKIDDGTYTLVRYLLSEAEKVEADRHKVVRLDYQKLMEGAKTQLGINLTNTHFERLEQKGLYVKRSTQDGGGVVLSFELPEFQRVFMAWKIIREINKWNDKGFIDPNEEKIKQPMAIGGDTCPACQGSIPTKAKFCSNCGHKIAA